jgi:hypothetical protein
MASVRIYAIAHEPGFGYSRGECADDVLRPGANR